MRQRVNHLMGVCVLGAVETVRVFTDAGTVTAVQKFLKSIGGGKAFPIKSDGTLDPETNAAVKKFNTDYRNTPSDREFITDGTLASMGIKPSSTPREVIIQPVTDKPKPKKQADLPTDGRPAEGWSQPWGGKAQDFSLKAKEKAQAAKEATKDFFAKIDDVKIGGVSAWKIGLGGLGGALVGFGIYKAVRR